MADLIGLGPYSAGLLVDTPELLFEGIVRACRTHNEDRNPDRVAVDAFEIWRGYVDEEQGWPCLMTTRSKSNYMIGQAYRNAIP